MKTPYITLDLFKLPESPRAAILGSSLILHDNFERKIRWDHAETTDFRDIPIKLSSTMTLFFCLDGEAHLRGSMKEFVMKKNDVVFAKSGLFGEVNNMSKDIKFAFVAMNEDFYYPILNSFDMSKLQKNLVSNPVCSLPEYSITECVTLYNMIKERLNHHKNDLLQEEIIKGYLQALIFNVYSQYMMASKNDKGNQPKLTRQQDIFNQFMELLQENYTKERNLNYYAERLCITPRYLSRIIHSVSGHFASNHIDLFVIAESKQLLRSKKYTILQVSEMLNFTSQSLFGRYFKKFTGYSPKQYQDLE
ncbi:AraC family transcriptional regulator [Bacteroides sp. 519]|uniref:helix-turn-helix domain-containing protein n=1 Tax=Bacteroides sp. 519 TaxID=2302937 RepID=UPI0013D2FABE|nr:AraC family transcriptional regulator [Bacteroides sp. 519]NDV57045.1 AraC family transcriptional regulator [Bacteroides sp. 519]